MADDPVAAFLGHARKEMAGASQFAAAGYGSRLLAAVEAVLVAHPSQVTANGKWVCPNCTRDMSVFVPADHCLIRVAISRALLGDGGTG